MLNRRCNSWFVCASLALLPSVGSTADAVRWRQAAEVTEVRVVLHEVSADALRAVAGEFEGSSPRGQTTRKGFAVLRTFADGSRRCDIWLLEGQTTKAKLATLGHEAAHCAGYSH